MATESDASFVGKRLAQLRKSKNITAAQLADLVPSSSITKTVITNVESGRKRDLTVTELIQLAAALNVPIVSLLVDTQSPWAPADLPGLINGLDGLSNVEYALKAGFLNSDGGFDRFDARLIEDLVEAEECLMRFEGLKLPLEDHSDGGEAYRRQLQTKIIQTLGSLAVLRTLREAPPAVIERIDRAEEMAERLRVSRGPAKNPAE